jgi:hypothetical protein
MNIDELTLGQLKQIKSMCGTTEKLSGCPWQIGKPYFIRTVTMILTGRMIDVTEQELVIEDAAWIADTGRYMEAVAEGKFNEVEPYPDGHKVIVGRNSVIDACEFLRPLPRKQK